MWFKEPSLPELAADDDEEDAAVGAEAEAGGGAAGGVGGGPSDDFRFSSCSYFLLSSVANKQNSPNVK